MPSSPPSPGTGQVDCHQTEARACRGGGQGVLFTRSPVALLPTSQGRSAPKYVAQDVFGYSFLSDVFMADYKDGEATWQGFLRPYPTPEAAKAVFDQYLSTVKKDGAEIKESKVKAPISSSSLQTLA